jgi:hypothetical protein
MGAFSLQATWSGALSSPAKFVAYASCQ